MVNEDRLSCLPDEILVQILSRMNTKYVVQTSLVSRRWKLLWTLVPCLKFSSKKFSSLHKFSEFVNSVLSQRNHEIDLSSVKLGFFGPPNHDIVRNIANYAFSHNVQNLTVFNPVESFCEFPPCLFSSKSLKHLAFRASHPPFCHTPKTPWDFPALTTMQLSHIALCNHEPFDIFSKCVNLKNLTLESFYIRGVKVFDIISPRLTNLILTFGKISSNVVNVIAPQLEYLEIYYCPIKYLNAPAGVSSFCYSGHHPPQMPKDHFHSLNKVTVNLDCHYCTSTGYEEGDAIEIISMLQQLHSARYLTLSLIMVQCLSSFPNLVSHLPSPFSNLICVKIDSRMWNLSNLELSSEVRKFLIDNSPDAVIMEPEMLSMAAKELTLRRIRRPRRVKQVGVKSIRSKHDTAQADEPQKPAHHQGRPKRTIKRPARYED